jgi:hypothetical protein
MVAYHPPLPPQQLKTSRELSLISEALLDNNICFSGQSAKPSGPSDLFPFPHFYRISCKCTYIFVAAHKIFLF